MITIKTEKGLIRFSNWEEIATRPGFTFELDPKQHKFKAVIGNYVEKEWVRCGITSCHTQHGKGYIVTTESGAETRIGKDCGKTIFGIEFDHEARRFERDKTAAEDRDALASFSFHIEDHEKRLADIRDRPRGARWLHPRLTALTTHGKDVPSPIRSVLANLARTRTFTVSRARALTQEERDLEEARLNRKLRPDEQTISEYVADIAGTEALYPEYDLRRLIAVELEEPLKIFKESDIDSMTFVELRRWAKWAVGVEGQIDRIEEAISLGGRMLTVQNLAPLNGLLSSRDDQQMFKRFLQQLA